MVVEVDEPVVSQSLLTVIVLHQKLDLDMIKRFENKLLLKILIQALKILYYVLVFSSLKDSTLFMLFYYSVLQGSLYCARKIEVSQREFYIGLFCLCCYTESVSVNTWFLLQNCEMFQVSGCLSSNQVLFLSNYIRHFFWKSLLNKSLFLSFILSMLLGHSFIFSMFSAALKYGRCFGCWQFRSEINFICDFELIIFPFKLFCLFSSF